MDKLIFEFLAHVKLELGSICVKNRESHFTVLIIVSKRAIRVVSMNEMHFHQNKQRIKFIFRIFYNVHEFI